MHLVHLRTSFKHMILSLMSLSCCYIQSNLFKCITHRQLVLLLLKYISFDRFQQTMLVLLNIGHIHFGLRNTALLMNMMARLGAAAVREWRSVIFHATTRRITFFFFLQEVTFTMMHISFYAATRHTIYCP